MCRGRPPSNILWKQSNQSEPDLRASFWARLLWSEKMSCSAFGPLALLGLGGLGGAFGGEKRQRGSGLPSRGDLLEVNRAVKPHAGQHTGKWSLVNGLGLGDLASR